VAGQQLQASLDGIERMGEALGQLAGAFESLTSVADDSVDAGHAELAGALSEFATGWSDMRNQLTGELKQLSQDAKTAVIEYAGTDNTLTHGLTNAGKGTSAPGTGKQSAARPNATGPGVAAPRTG
jgi:hypothetical protein